MDIKEQANFIWSIADLLRGNFKQSEYGKVILPFTVLRRFDCVLAPSKEEILERNKSLAVSNKAPIFKKYTGHDYYNVSKFDFEKLIDDSNNIDTNLKDYINGFSDDVKEILDRQITCNMAIANEGIHNSYGANIGHVILNMDSDCVKTRAKAYAAAGSDARMNGCELPVVINSGSGNQGITCCVPVVVYAKELDCTQEQLYRALVLSNLTAIYIKTGIGTLSAFCGAVSAGAAAGAGIAYLHNGTYKEIQHTIVNALAILSGTICDGAKASCAAKIASSIDAGIMGYYMYKNKQQFYAGDGIVAHSVDETIQNIGTLGSQGMLQTNDKIIEMMISCD